MEANVVTTLVLEIHSAGTVIHGRPHGSGPGRRFTGWLGIAAVLEQALRSPRGLGVSDHQWIRVTRVLLLVLDRHLCPRGPAIRQQASTSRTRRRSRGEEESLFLSRPSRGGIPVDRRLGGRWFRAVGALSARRAPDNVYRVARAVDVNPDPTVFEIDLVADEARVNLGNGFRGPGRSPPMRLIKEGVRRL